MANYEDADMRPEYDFTGAERGRYKDRFPPGSIAIIDHDLLESFPDSRTVNEALRAHLEYKRLKDLQESPPQT